MRSKEEVFYYPDNRLDVKNTSRYLGLSVKTLAMLRSAGKGPRFIKRGRIFYYKQDLDEWLRAGQATSTAQAASRTIRQAD